MIESRPLLSRFVIAVVWWCVALLLLGWTAVYLRIHALHHPGLDTQFAIVATIAMSILFYTDGIATAIGVLATRDLRSLPRSTATAIERVIRSGSSFELGRQGLAVVATITLAIVCARLSDVGDLSIDEKLAFLLPLVKDAHARELYSVAFPVMIVTWFVQIPAGLVAGETPVDFATWTPFRLLTSGALYWWS